MSSVYRYDGSYRSQTAGVVDPGGDYPLERHQGSRGVGIRHSAIVMEWNITMVWIGWMGMLTKELELTGS